MKVCPRCQGQIDNEVKFCPYCGMKLPVIQTESSVENDIRSDDGRQTENLRGEVEKTSSLNQETGKLSSNKQKGEKKGGCLPVFLLIGFCSSLYLVFVGPYKNGIPSFSKDFSSEYATTEQAVVLEEKQEVRVLGPEASISELLNGAEEIQVSDVEATSTIHQEGRSNEPALLFDKDEMTNWQEGVKGYGEGEKVTAYFDSPHEIRMISFKNGNWLYTSKRGHDYYDENCRPKILCLYFGNQKFVIPFQDVMEEQLVMFKYPIPCESMIVEIVEVYPGSRFRDTVITDITVYGTKEELIFPESEGSWIEDESGRWYQNVSGSYTIDGWQTIDGNLYYFDESGYVVRDQWVEWNENSYYLREDGKLLVDGTAPDGSRVDINGIKQ